MDIKATIIVMSDGRDLAQKNAHRKRRRQKMNKETQKLWQTIQNSKSTKIKYSKQQLSQSGRSITAHNSRLSLFLDANRFAVDAKQTSLKSRKTGARVYVRR